MTGRWFIIIALTGMFFCAGFTGLVNAQDTETVYIGEGDYYNLGPYYGWGNSDLWVNMTVVHGGNVDIYVMSSNQYYNAYSSEPYLYEQGGEVPGGIAFKSNSQENVSQANIYQHIEIDIEQEMWMEEEIWVVIDNRNTNATPNDATPTGNVQIELETKWITDEYGYYDDFFWMDGLFCLAAILPTALIILLLFLIYRKMGKKKEIPPPMPYQPYPPPMGQNLQEPVAPIQPPLEPVQPPDRQ